MEPLLKIDRLSGGYRTGRPVLHNISLEVKAGKMVGLIGLNGAGKSTTMKHILGLLEPHVGKVMINGKTLSEDAESYRSAIAYVPESPLLYEALTVREHLIWTATAYGVEQALFEKRVQELANLFHMTAHLDKAAQHLSKGMRQKTMLMCAFAVRPPLYIIDEPFLGLDPLGIRSLLKYMKQVQAEGASLLVSSHILSTIEHDCDTFVLLHQGKVLAAGTVQELHDQYAVKAGKRADERLEDLFYAWVCGDGSLSSMDGVRL